MTVSFLILGNWETLKILEVKQNNERYFLKKKSEFNTEQQQNCCTSKHMIAQHPLSTKHYQPTLHKRIHYVGIMLKD